MDLSLVRTFGQVVESQSFTIAARTLGLPKSSVSRAVARLEEQLGAGSPPVAAPITMEWRERSPP